LETALLEEVLGVFDSETLRCASGDIFGRINEYFLMKLAMQKSADRVRSKLRKLSRAGYLTFDS